MLDVQIFRSVCKRDRLSSATFFAAIYSIQNFKKCAERLNISAACPSNLYMKKILLLSAVLLGAVSASQAGVRFNLGFGIPLPPPPVVVAPAPVYVQPSAPVCVNPPVYVTPQVCAPAPLVVTPPVVGFGFGHFHGPDFRHDFHGHYRR
jgi:hypothetical protein